MYGIEGLIIKQKILNAFDIFLSEFWSSEKKNLEMPRGLAVERRITNFMN